jgi:plastocyanin
MERALLACACAVPMVVAAAPASAPAVRSSPASAASGPAVTVKLGEYFFRPKRVTVTAGTPIRFLNVGKIEHTVADSTRSGTIRSRLIHPRPLRRGQSQTVVLRRPGTVYYLCTFHPTLMRGVIVVR